MDQETEGRTAGRVSPQGRFFGLTKPEILLKYEFYIKEKKLVISGPVNMVQSGILGRKVKEIYFPAPSPIFFNAIQFKLLKQIDTLS